MEVTINARHDESTELYPISRGPYAGIDFLYIEDTWCGTYEVRRHKTNGELVEDYGRFSREDALAKVRELQTAQGTKDCNAVTGNGRWSCD